MRNIVRGGVVFNAVLVLLAVVLLCIDRNSLIITVGIVLANYLLAGGWILLGVLFAAGNLLLLGRARHKRRAHALAAVHTLPIELTRPDELSPQHLREELRYFYGTRPALQQQIDAAFAQMDSMDRKQAKLRRIFERNGVNTLDEVQVTMRDAERALCRHIAKLINRIILWDPLECNKPGKEAIYEGHRSYMRGQLESGEEILSKCDILLAETVSYLDEKEAGIDSGKLHLDVMTQTIQSLRSISSDV